MDAIPVIPILAQKRNSRLSAYEKRSQFQTSKSKATSSISTGSEESYFSGSFSRHNKNASVESYDSGVCLKMLSDKSTKDSNTEVNSANHEDPRDRLISSGQSPLETMQSNTLEDMPREEDKKVTVTTNINKKEELSNWQKCIAFTCKKYGYRALRRNEYPDQKTLNKIFKKFGKKDKLTLKTCDQICSLIRSKAESIVDVFAAVREGKIEFVIIVNKRVRLEKVIEYSFVKRMVGDVSNEGKEVIDNHEFDSFWSLTSSASKNKLRRCIQESNIELMKNHRYLMMISGSPVRSKGFNSQSHKIEREACIVLCVLIKGYIPIQEEPFEKKYLGVPVDVREGCFIPFTRPAGFFHDSLKSGCQIQREGLGTGTLGGFVDYHEFGTCGITCAHVLLHEVELKNLAPTTENDMELGYSATGHTIYQPKYTPCHKNAVGKVVKAIFREGGRGESGIDIAVFKVEQRLPFVGEFPALNDGRRLNMSYDSGKVVDVSRIFPGPVLKFGAESDLTEGSFVTEESTNSVKAFVTYESTNPYKIILHNLLEIRALDRQSRFAEPGDSGALVFCKGEDNELICVGVVEGGTTHGTCIVMPISPILEQLDVTTMKCFETNRKFEQGMKEKFDDLRNSISNDITASEMRTIQRVTQNEQTVLNFLSTFEHNMNEKFQNLYAAHNNNL